MSNPIRIILVDNEVLFRKGISFLLDGEENIDVVFEASDGNELISFLKEKGNIPDIIIMDLKMPFLNGVEAIKSIRNDFPEIKIIALTSSNSKSFVANMIDVGAVSFLIKNATPQELLTAVNEVATKGFYYNDFVLNVINEYVSNKKGIKCYFDTNYLTSREIEILRLICKQKNTVEIAEQLFISPRTVEGHRNNLLLKTESKNIAGLVVFAIQNEIAIINN
ncbi:response regulator transcription factor [Flavobacterium sp. ZB4P13]|uniref:response regulator transcription factor n=1 Tax=Flavobacterium sp. ZB4P13 TaxID=3401728 RepID=UPI003AAE95D6